MITFEDAIKAVVVKVAKDCKKEITNKIDYIPYGMPDSKGLINASVPLTRRERRVLKRKKGK